MQPVSHSMSEGKSSSRRSLLQRAAGIGLGAVAGIALLPRRSWARFRYVPFYDPLDDKRTLNYLLLVKRLEAAFYNANADKPYIGSGFGVSTLKSLTDEIRSHENAQVALLEQALGAKADPAPNIHGVDAPTLDQFLQMAQAFEDIGVSAYLGALPTIHDAQILAMAADIAAVEARHAGGLRAHRKGVSTAAGGDPNTSLTESGEAVNTSRTQDQVLALFAQFLAIKAA